MPPYTAVTEGFTLGPVGVSAEMVTYPGGSKKYSFDAHVPLLNLTNNLEISNVDVGLVLEETYNDWFVTVSGSGSVQAAQGPFKVGADVAFEVRERERGAAAAQAAAG